jgi:hypothetical protein
MQVWQSSSSFVGKEKVMLTCLQIGHTRLTYGHFLHGELAIVCTDCGAALIYFAYINGVPTL